MLWRLKSQAERLAYLPRSSCSARNQLSCSLPPVPEAKISYARLAICSPVICLGATCLGAGAAAATTFGIDELRTGLVTGAFMMGLAIGLDDLAGIGFLAMMR